MDPESTPGTVDDEPPTPIILVPVGSNSSNEASILTATEELLIVPSISTSTSTENSSTTTSTSWAGVDYSYGSELYQSFSNGLQRMLRNYNSSSSCSNNSRTVDVCGRIVASSSKKTNRDHTLDDSPTSSEDDDNNNNNAKANDAIMGNKNDNNGNSELCYLHSKCNNFWSAEIIHKDGKLKTAFALLAFQIFVIVTAMSTHIVSPSSSSSPLPSPSPRDKNDEACDAEHKHEHHQVVSSIATTSSDNRTKHAYEKNAPTTDTGDCCDDHGHYCYTTTTTTIQTTTQGRKHFLKLILLTLGVILSVVVILSTTVGIYKYCAINIKNQGRENENENEQSKKAPLSPSASGGEDGITSSIIRFGGNLMGRPYFVHSKSNFGSTIGNTGDGGDTNNDDDDDAETKNAQLQFLVTEVMSPIVTQISEREGFYLSDYVASRRNDESIVTKGSPQHNALAWLSHAIRCRRRQSRETESSVGSGSSSNINVNRDYDYSSTSEQHHDQNTTTTTIDGNGNGKERNHRPDHHRLYDYDCESTLSRSQIINRYALATIYFAWKGKSWHHSEGWMSYYKNQQQDDEDNNNNDSSLPAPFLMSRNSSLTTTATTTISPPPRKSSNTTFDSYSRYPSDICLWKGVTCRHEENTNDGIAFKTNEAATTSTPTNKGARNESSRIGEEPEPVLLVGEQIVGLSLPDNNLVGFLSTVKEIGLLADLEVLDLSRNHLEGTIPKDIGRLSRLRSLLLSGNTLSGALPSTITGGGSSSSSHAHGLLQVQIVRLEDNQRITGLDGFRFAPPCNEAPLELSSDCAGEKPKVVCPCCTLCCGNIAIAAPDDNDNDSYLRSGGKKIGETMVCTEHLRDNNRRLRVRPKRTSTNIRNKGK